MKTKQITWRKATDKELAGGLPEMIIESEIEYDEEFKMEVQMWKLKSVLSSMGLLTQVSDALNSLPEPTKTTALIAWEYSPTVSSQSSTTKFVQNVLSLTDEELEQIFIASDSISLEDQQPQNRSKSSVFVPEISPDGSVKIQEKKIRIKYNWFQRFTNWVKRIFKRKK